MWSSNNNNNNNSNNNNNVPADTAVTLYFVVFPCNSAPIFHSNRIPRRDDTPPYTPGDVIYLGPAEEVAQEKLQGLAFPLGLPSKSAVTQRGPLWSSNVEFVRKMGDVRYVRLMIASTFVVSVASETEKMRTMHTKHAAVALVITCPPDKPYYQLLLDNFDGIMRQLLHISLEFAMGATQQFFFRLSRTLTAVRLASEMERQDYALRTYQTLASVLVNAFTHKFSIPRIHSRAGELNVDSKYVSSSSSSNIPQVAKVSVVCLVHEALYYLRRFNEEFTSAVLAGLLSLSNWESYGLISHPRRYGDEQHNQQHQDFAAAADDDDDDENDSNYNNDDIYSDYWKIMEAREKYTLTSPEQRLSSDKSSSSSSSKSNSNDAAPKNDWSEDVKFTETSSAVSAGNDSRRTSDVMGVAGAAGTRTTCSLSLNRKGRVIIFSTDPKQARYLLIIAAFFFRDSPIAARSTGHSVNPIPFAAKVDSCAYSSLPVQWVAQEYDPHRVKELLCSPHSVENTVLIIAPRAMVCRRLRLVKTFSTNPILVERFRERFQPVRPFQSQLVNDEEMRSDNTVRAALKEALFLHEKTDGVVNCVEFLEYFIIWILRRSCTSHRLQQLQEGETKSFVSCDLLTTNNPHALSFSLGSFGSIGSVSSLLRPDAEGGFFRFSRFFNHKKSSTTRVSGGNASPANGHSRAYAVGFTDMDLEDTTVGSQLMRLLTEYYEEAPLVSLRSGKGYVNRIEG
ncbi:uncharacterized protein TM35_000481450 [Trypanosoma theileri]|uniref:Uncharacterized protein n=1 Tax=Trypanosoma theileri TaxID=67003 RepID=A0A1X0NHE6_9TRYP|nr:uncharacterized protein TM35_000481450 [Trypanosoma theileri]ORC84184.1 hypothetical protein TM35_000481450 [Trypanosoma theileri]